MQRCIAEAICSPLPEPEHFLRVENGGGDDPTHEGHATPAVDRSSRRGCRSGPRLANDPKERSENIMAVDVARNDHEPYRRAGSVRVDELCG